ncbi:DNA polymerase I [Methylobacterium mesophilicum SR1.6/6]|uniref:DNA polymerase I n=1 Tax=Methylobacterium mesophilicum SR1.6/6 TaxID=908290 RepID=A0A6B9FLX8_9HYPH|nr:DNA polymerase [Methylobacterium mesophilicum]QGY03621.1 DNA polymerase I [Methylobacterium mesophilicum SR1.6/6]
MNNGEGSGLAALRRYRQIWLVDFEFQVSAGERQYPICMVAQEFRSGRIIRMWRNELITLRQAPFDCGTDSLFVAFYNSAELNCFLALGWTFPACILDLYVEHRCSTNGISLPWGDGLIGALACRRLTHIDVDEKDCMRRLIMDNSAWSAAEQVAILNYCQSDVTALEALLPQMVPELDLPQALLRGRYMAAAARMEWTGIPIDVPVYNQLRASWEDIRTKLVADVDRDYGVYDGLTFKQARFGEYLMRSGINWPRYPNGQLILDDDTFKLMVEFYPKLALLRQLRKTMAKLNDKELPIGSDNRNRCMISAFKAKTSRNQPKSSEFVFGRAKWLRGIIRPPEGYGLAYIDFSSQENAIAAALSGDELMMQGYAEGDPYLAFAKAARLVPPDATVTTHKGERDRCKSVVLGMNYGMGADTLAISLGITPVEAKALMRLHKDTYRKFWSWVEKVINAATFTGQMRSLFGWRHRIVEGVSASALMNFPMQSNGAEMLRIAAIAGTEAGIEVCAPVHDAFLIQAPLGQIKERAAQMGTLMTEAGRAVTGGFPVRTDVKIVRYPDRYMDDGGQAMWDRVMALLPEVGEGTP